MEKPPKEILTVVEAAELLQIPVASLYKLARAGKLPAQKVGRHWRFSRQALLGWVGGAAYAPPGDAHGR